MEPVYFVGAGPGDPGLITVKGLGLLESADLLVYTGSLVNPELVRGSPAPEKLDSHGMAHADIIARLEKAAREGKRVVRLHSGDPSLYGAIVEQILALEDRGIPSVVVPGVSSLFGAAAALGTQLTLKGVSESLIVTRPAGETLEEDRIPELSALGETLAIFLGGDRISDVVARLRSPPETPAAVVYHASWGDERVVKGTVSDIARRAEEAGIRRTALIIVGKVVEPRSSGFRRSHLYP
ncbi:MAG: cobalt-precorrin-4/precorrin-4 C(11)-methyltransferase [Methanomicrobiales archaeon]|nr:cobalt-precorrin-4/precorrin-4 C(11)-methyltransferase [Methanomicrobiales archaeon]MDD1670901.1 cobalt-precorrin-4/precorrin-4 C(11)-methyltransferase [Methanomicrobiales archaeon]